MEHPREILSILLRSFFYFSELVVVCDDLHLSAHTAPCKLTRPSFTLLCCVGREEVCSISAELFSWGWWGADEIVVGDPHRRFV